MNILVTGGAGFIGSHVVDCFLKAGHRVVAVDDLSMGNKKNVNKAAKFYRADIRSKKISRIIKKEHINVIDHHAAQISVPDSVKDPCTDADININGTMNLLKAACKYGVKKVIFISSGGTVYGTPKKFPVSERLPLNPENPYGISKVAGEAYVKFFAGRCGMDYTVLRYSNVYGPRQIPHGEAGVVSIFIERILKNLRPVIFGGGTCVRDYVYVGDAARANVLALKKGGLNEFNIGTGIPTSVNKLYRVIQKATGFKKNALKGPFRKGDILKNYLDAKKARRILKWKPETGIEEGVRKTYEYFKNK